MIENDMFSKTWTSFYQFESCKRLIDSSQSLTEFIHQWKIRLEEVQSYGIEYSDYVLALKLVYSCQLTEQIQTLVLHMLQQNKSAKKGISLWQALMCIKTATSNIQNLEIKEELKLQFIEDSDYVESKEDNTVKDDLFTNTNKKETEKIEVKEDNLRIKLEHDQDLIDSNTSQLCDDSYHSNYPIDVENNDTISSDLSEEDKDQVESIIEVSTIKKIKSCDIDNVERKISCDDCKKVFLTVSTLNRHMKDVHKKKFECRICQMKFLRKIQFTNHVTSHQMKGFLKGGSFQCETCGKEFESARKYSLHIRNHWDFVCRPCGNRRFKTQVDLEDHVKNHKEMSCVNCGGVYPSTRAYDIHKGKGFCSKIEQIACEVCGKLYASKQNLSQHKQTHKEAQWFCKVAGCSKSFVKKDYFNQHMRRHDGIKNYKCHLCPRAFVNKTTLNRHLERHIGRRKFACSECSKSFITKDNYNSHIRTHSGEKPHSCDVCNKVFCRKWNLTKHKKSAHAI